MGWFGRKSSAPSIDSLKFETHDWTFHGEMEPGQMRLWETADEDAVVLNYFGIPPDLPVARTFTEIFEMYAVGLAAAGGKIVECASVKFAGCDAIRLLFKVPQQPAGLMYQAAVTVPFRDFSFVIKIQCSEQGTTGVREAVLLNQRLKAGEKPNNDQSGKPFPDWNPDAAEFDAMFPTHPVSRVRRLLLEIENSATLAEEIRRLPKFPLPYVC